MWWLVVLVLVEGIGAASTPGVTVRGDPVTAVPSGRAAVLRVPGDPVDRRPVDTPPLPSDSGWMLVDSLVRQSIIPAGERLAIRFDETTASLRDTLLPGYLTELGRRAVDVAPTWLQDELSDNFRRLGSTQDVYADLIVNCPDKRYFDELCFQVAHLAPSAFINLPPELLVDNVQLMYRIDPLLQYVDIVDYGDALQGGDYYSTTRYRAVVGGETTDVEIPRDIYYWWIVMPKITDEAIKYVYGFFWRDYLFYHADSGYPVLAEKLAPTAVLWDGERHTWPNQGQGYPDSLLAVAVVSRWTAHTLPFPASGNRPIQPVQIAMEHDGNCGEVQDLLCAAARTALIPCGGVLDINEDHVWCEIWWQGEFHPWQVDLGGGATNIRNPGIAYDREHGGGKNCSAIWDWRNDGWQRSVIATYSGCCTLTVEVSDADGRPADGAIVRLQSEGWQTSQLYNCFFGVTDRTGRYTTTLGDWQNYYLTVTGDLGIHSAGQIIDSAGCAPGNHFAYACTLDGRRDSLVASPDSAAGLDAWRLDVDFQVRREAVYGHDCWNSGGSNEYRLVADSGVIDFFVADGAEFGRYTAGEPFAAFGLAEDSPGGVYSLVLGRTGDHFVVFSNEEQANATAFVDVSVRLYRRDVGIAGEPGRGPAGGLAVAPTPFTDRLLIRTAWRIDRGTSARIVDAGGRLVRRLVPADGGWCWDGSDESGRRVGAGVYFCVVEGPAGRVVRPAVLAGAR